MSRLASLPTAEVSTLKLKPTLKLSLVAFGLVLMLGASVAFISDILYSPNQFNISKITLTGDATHVSRASLKRSVIEMIDGNYFSLDTQKILSALYALPWVEKVRLRRQWPDTLMINIEEYQPIALWGDERWLTTSEKLVTLPLPKNIRLPHLDGPQSAVKVLWKKYQDWSDKFGRQGMRLHGMSLSKQHLYVLKLEYTTQQPGVAKNFKMILSEENADQQLKVFLDSHQQGLIEASGLIKTVDLRYPSGFSVSHYEPENLVQTDSK